MAERKTPILLRRGPLSGEVMAIYRYRKVVVNERELLDVSAKQSVQSDYDCLVLQELLDPDAPDIVGILDGVADGEQLDDEQRRQVRAFRERLRTMVERWNTHVDREVADG